MAGYNGYAKSNNAILAENSGRYPLGKASRVLAKKLNWSLEKSKAFLKKMGTVEYHHTSCKYNCTDYYDVSDEALSDLKEEIDDFIYKPKPKEPSITWFKCYNIDNPDPRKWDWKITNRDGNHCYEIDFVKSKLIDLLDQWVPRQAVSHKSKKRVADETVTSINNILIVLTKKEK